MHILTAYERRASLSPSELSRLEAALADDVERYRVATRSYTPEKLSRYGQPHLAKLEARLADVRQLIAKG